jgi:hypothetical protein
MKRRISLLTLIFLNVFICVVIASDTLYFSFDGSTTDTPCYPPYDTGQTFINTGNYSLTSIKFKIKKHNSPSGTCEVYLYSASSQLPTGGILATSDGVDCSTLPAVSTNYEFIFSGANQYSMIDGNEYAFILSVGSGNGSQYVEWQATGSGNAYADGQTVYWGGSSWGPYTNRDGTLYVYGVEGGGRSPGRLRGIATSIGGGIGR